MVQRKIYLSGPMTGIPDFNKPAFNAVAEELRSMGFDVFNPVENGLPDHAEWLEHMRADIKALMDCTDVVLLPGWESSAGASLEAFIASKLGYKVYPFKQGF